MSFFFKVLVIYLIALVVPKVARAEFVPLGSDRTETCTLKLTEAEGIPHQCLTIKDLSSPLEVWQSRLSFDFGQLSQTDFNKLQTIYGRWSQQKSLVTYHPQQSYQLIDFLPPLVQALNSHRFVPEVTKLKLTKKQNSHSLDNAKQTEEKFLDLKPSLYLNCWGLTYEIWRAAKQANSKPTLFMAQSSLMLEQIQRNSVKVLSLEKSDQLPIPGVITQPGDLILIWHRSKSGNIYLDHTAIAVADGVYFEKAGTGENVPIRLIDQATMLKIWSPEVFNYEIRRLKNTGSLPQPRQVFSLDSPEIKSKFAELKNISSEISKDISIAWDLELENLGLKDLELDSLQAISWFHLIDLQSFTFDETGRAKLNKQVYQPLLSNLVKQNN